MLVKRAHSRKKTVPRMIALSVIRVAQGMSVLGVLATLLDPAKPVRKEHLSRILESGARSAKHAGIAHMERLGMAAKETLWAHANPVSLAPSKTFLETTLASARSAKSASLVIITSIVALHRVVAAQPANLARSKTLPDRGTLRAHYAHLAQVDYSGMGAKASRRANVFLAQKELTSLVPGPDGTQSARPYPPVALVSSVWTFQAPV